MPVAASRTCAFCPVVADTTIRVPSGDCAMWSAWMPSTWKRHTIWCVTMSKATTSARFDRDTYSVRPSCETNMSSTNRSPPSCCLTSSYPARSSGVISASRWARSGMTLSEPRLSKVDPSRKLTVPARLLPTSMTSRSPAAGRRNVFTDVDAASERMAVTVTAPATTSAVAPATASEWRVRRDGVPAIERPHNVSRGANVLGSPPVTAAEKTMNANVCGLDCGRSTIAARG